MRCAPSANANTMYMKSAVGADDIELNNERVFSK